MSNNFDMTSGMGPAGLSRCAATPGHAAACGATAKHKAWDAPCQEMGYDFVALPIETGGRQPEEAEQFLDRLVKYAGSGGRKGTRVGQMRGLSRPRLVTYKMFVF